MKVFEKHYEYGNTILEKSFRFGKTIIKFYLIRTKNDFHVKNLLKKLLSSVIAIGTNVAVTQEVSSKKNHQQTFVALKEVPETHY